MIEDIWTGTVARARELPEPILHEQVEGEWSSAHPTNQADRSWQVLSDALRLSGIGRVIRR
jgi:hypothetical protein